MMMDMMMMPPRADRPTCRAVVVATDPCRRQAGPQVGGKGTPHSTGSAPEPSWWRFSAAPTSSRLRPDRSVLPESSPARPRGQTLGVELGFGVLGAWLRFEREGSGVRLGLAGLACWLGRLLGPAWAPCLLWARPTPGMVQRRSGCLRGQACCAGSGGGAQAGV